LQGGGTSTGTFNVATGSTVNFDSGSYVLNNGTALNGAGLYRQPGTFDGLTININLTCRS
jgi:hypothetical protein